MHSRVLTILGVTILTSGITVNGPGGQTIASKSKIELNPILISCGLNDIVILSAPFIVSKHSLYYLNKPSADVIKLDIPRPNTERIIRNSSYDNIVVKYVKEGIKIIKPGLDYKKIFNLNMGSLQNDVENTFEENMKYLEANDFLIGPLTEEDHGNWVLSIYVMDIDDDWIEFFQAITIEITESVPATSRKPQLSPGKTFNLSFAYPIKNLESCQIVAPKSTFDRFYDRNPIDLDNCGFIIPNVTKEDEGIWRLIGVGSIVYEARAFLKVDDKS